MRHPSQLDRQLLSCRLDLQNLSCAWRLRDLKLRLCVWSQRATLFVVLMMSLVQMASAESLIFVAGFADRSEELRSELILAIRRGALPELAPSYAKVKKFTLVSKEQAKSLGAFGFDKSRGASLAVVKLDSTGRIERVLWRDSGGSPRDAVDQLVRKYGKYPQEWKQTGRKLKPLGKNSSGFREFRNEKDGTVLLRVSAGRFPMGSQEGNSVEMPRHSVNLPLFYMAKTEVTNAQFRRFVRETGYTPGNPKWRQASSRAAKDAPVVLVDWIDATAYCRWAGLRLPGEQEWEKAARSSLGLTYPWGNDFGEAQTKYMEASRGQTLPVGSFPAMASPYGCHDMAGNVAEWTSTWYFEGYTTSRRRMPQQKALRGCSWYNNYRRRGYDPFRGAARNSLHYAESSDNVGFRCAR